MGTVTFHEALELIESLSEGERQSFVEISKRRLDQEPRNDIVDAIAEARKDYASGEVRRDTIGDLLESL